MKGTSPLLSCAIVFVKSWRFAVAVSFLVFAIDQYLKRPQILVDIFRYLWASSDICGTFRYLWASSNVRRCQPPVRKILTSHMEYTGSLPAPLGFPKAWPTKPRSVSLWLGLPDCKPAGYPQADLAARERCFGEIGLVTLFPTLVCIPVLSQQRSILAKIWISQQKIIRYGTLRLMLLAPYLFTALTPEGHCCTLPQDVTEKGCRISYYSSMIPVLWYQYGKPGRLVVCSWHKCGGGGFRIPHGNCEIMYQRGLPHRP